MRIIAGIAKGRKLKSPKGKNVRPLSEQAREALFNILVNKVAGASFLDLFAGTGAVGLEALSRGAKTAVFIEKDHRVAALLKENVALCGFKKEALVFVADAKRAVKILHSKGKKFDIIFIGAPYESPELELTVKALLDWPILNPDGIMVVEHRHKYDFRLDKASREARYGDTVLKFYEDRDISGKF